MLLKSYSPGGDTLLETTTLLGTMTQSSLVDVVDVVDVEISHFSFVM